jgi:hypothetical protein
MPRAQDNVLTADDLTKWVEKIPSGTATREGENPGDAFFTSSELRDRYSVPYNEYICLIDVAAFPEGDPVEGLEYSKRTEFVPSKGNVFQLLLSKDEEKLAVTSAYALEALKTGAISPDELAAPGDGPRPFGLALPIVGAVKCAANAACRQAVAKGAGAVAGWAGGNAAWDELKRRLNLE